MTRDELIEYLEFYKQGTQKIPDDGCHNGVIKMRKAVEIALATLKADKMGYKLCEFKESVDVDSRTICNWYEPVRTELVKILKELE